MPKTLCILVSLSLCALGSDGVWAEDTPTPSALSRTVRIWDIEQKPPPRISPLCAEEQSLYLEASFQGPYLVARRMLLQPDGGDPSEKWDFQVIDTRKRPLKVTANSVLDATEDMSPPELSLSGDGNLLAEAGVDRKVRIWKRVGERFHYQCRVMLEGDGTAHACRFSKDGHVLGTWGQQAEIYDLDVSPPKRLMMIHEPTEGNGHRYSGGFWAPDGKTVALSKTDGGASLWRTDSGKPRSLGEVPTWSFPDFWFLSATSCVSIAGKEKGRLGFLFWEIDEAGLKLSRNLPLRSPGKWVGVNPAKGLLIFWDRGEEGVPPKPQQIIGVDWRNGGTRFRFELPGPARRVAVSEDGALLAVVNRNGTLALYHTPYCPPNAKRGPYQAAARAGGWPMRAHTMRTLKTNRWQRGTPCREARPPAWCPGPSPAPPTPMARSPSASR